MNYFRIPVDKQASYDDFAIIHKEFCSVLYKTGVMDFLEGFEFEAYFRACLFKQFWYWYELNSNLFPRTCSIGILWNCSEEMSSESFLDEFEKYDVIVEIPDNKTSIVMKLSNFDQVQQPFKFNPENNSYLD